MSLLKTDEQTIDDLRIFGGKSGDGIYDIYNRASTRGGEAVLDKMFRNPLSDRKAINKRSSIIESFAGSIIGFPYNASLFDTAEKYLLNTENGDRKNNQASLGEKEIQNGVSAIIEIIRLTKTFIDSSEIKSIAAYENDRIAISGLIGDPAFEPALKETSKEKLPYNVVTAYDVLFRVTEKSKLERLLGYIYHLDVYMSVAKLTVEKKFVFPKALEKESCTLKIENVYHPSLKNPVGNNVVMNASRNVIFLTGANMAGKSTFLRSLSTALYMAHMGFPVAADKMEFSVMDGIYTTINLPDNLGIGASHFYAEVLRVKKMASELRSGKSFFILFDELFRGTNVKDAFEATVAVVKGFASKSNSMFMISSHIVEAGEALKEKNNIDYLYLPTRMNGHIPEYTYTLEKGITDDRHGMLIIRNEGILEILKKGKNKITT